MELCDVDFIRETFLKKICQRKPLSETAILIDIKNYKPDSQTSVSIVSEPQRLFARTLQIASRRVPSSNSRPCCCAPRLSDRFPLSITCRL